MILILDHVQTYSTYADGEVIYRLIVAELQAGRPVTVSFAGIKSITSAFANAALIRLVEKFEFDYIRSNVKIVDSTRQINRLIKDRFHFATTEQASPVGR